ncbi:MAG: type II secretion system F family protein [Elusimicrobiaceae bacterium]|nr:type II secretion system F family protein [Elusimicrobiaceae bacterium]MBP5616741.1 type II secretion system F family protein [Elusimicrobiaceae bacterium]
MPKYTYKVRDEQGKTFTGSYTTDNKERLITALQNKGYLVLEITEASKGLFASKAGPRRKGGKVPGHVLAFFAEQLSTLIAGGVPLVRAVALLGQYSSHPTLGMVLNQVAHDISGGQSLHEAMAQHPKTFNHVWLSLIEAGEVGGTIADTLMQLSIYTKTQEGMKSKIITAITYPAILCVASVGVLIYFIVGIVPTFAQIFADFNLTLPTLTIVVLKVSSLITNHAVLIILTIVALIFAFRFYIHTPTGRKKWHNFLITMPIFGNFIRNIYYTRMLSTLSTLLRSGVTILNAITVLEEAFEGNVILRNALRSVRADVAAGRSISDAFAATAVFPGLMTEMMKMGEESGKLPSIIATLSKFYADAVDQFIARFSAVIDPILIVGVGVLIGIIVASIFLPIFKLSQIGS